MYSSRATLESALGETSGRRIRGLPWSIRRATGCPGFRGWTRGTVELVESMGPEVVSSADLMQYATQRWSAEQLASHQRAGEALGRIVKEAFARIGQRLADGVTEFEIAEFIRRRFGEEGLTTADGPIVSANAHCSDPHYEPAAEGSSVIEAGDWVLIDLWAREDTPGSVYADITWTAYVGDDPPERHRQVFDIVLGARDAALGFLQDTHAAGDAVQGWQVDDVARRYIAERGYGEYFTPPAGAQHLPHGPRRGGQPGQL